MQYEELVKNKQIPEISYRTTISPEVVHPRVIYRDSVPHVYCKKVHVPIATFMTRFASGEKDMRLAGYRSNGRQTSFSLSKSSQLTFGPLFLALIKELQTKATHPVEQSSPQTSPAVSHTPTTAPIVTRDEQKKLESDTKSLATSEREAVVKVRYGQGAFRDALVKLHGAACWMSGIEGKQLLIASHIKPWSQCKEDTDARGNSDNGLLLSSLWDAAFDAGLISFGSDWLLICSDQLSDSAKQALGITNNTVLPEEFRNKARAEFLTHHRESCFERWKK